MSRVVLCLIIVGGVGVLWILTGVGFLLLVLWDERKHPTPGVLSLRKAREIILNAFPLYIVFWISFGLMYVVKAVLFVEGIISVYIIPFFSFGRYTTGGDRVNKSQRYRR